MGDAIDKTIGYHREWLVKNGKRILERDTQYLREDLKEGTPQSFQQIPDSLDGLATYFGIRGAIDLLDGSTSGLACLSTAIDLRGWGLKIRAESFFRNLGVTTVNLTNYASRAACLVCVSEKWNAYAKNVLRCIESDANAIDQDYWHQRRFEPFVLKCLEQGDGNVTGSHEELAPPYERILTEWTNSAGLEVALEEACDYHCRNMDDTGGDWDPEFKNPPFDLLPCEVMLVKRIRVNLGMPMPKVNHRLVSLLGLDALVIPVCGEHELVRSVATAFERCFGGGPA